MPTAGVVGHYAVQIKALSVDTIKVTKCYTNAATGSGQMLIQSEQFGHDGSSLRISPGRDPHR
jgi:hypothetical protein